MFMFQCPVLPELILMAEDLKGIEHGLKEAKLDDKEIVEAYKYAFRDFTTWNRSINYYRNIFTKNLEFQKSIGAQLKSIEVRTLHIFGTADNYLGVPAAQNSAKYVKNYQLELLKGVTHWVQQETPEQ